MQRMHASALTVCLLVAQEGCSSSAPLTDAQKCEGAVEKVAETVRFIFGRWGGMNACVEGKSQIESAKELSESEVCKGDPASDQLLKHMATDVAARYVQHCPDAKYTPVSLSH